MTTETTESKSSASYWTPTLGLIGGWVLFSFWPGAIVGGLVGWGVGKGIDAARAAAGKGIQSALTKTPGTSPGPLPGASITTWPTTHLDTNPNSISNAGMMAGTGSMSGVSLGDTFGLMTGNPGVTMTDVTVDDPSIFNIPLSKPAKLPATSIALVPVKKGKATFHARLSTGDVSVQTVTVG